ncbi:MAG: Pyruvate kinase, partial [Actinomycetota bacterium]
MRRAKIVATFGPALSEYEKTKAAILAGVDVARLNLSHGDYSVHEKSFNNIRSASKEVGKPVGVLVDLQGPKIRVGTMLEGAQVITAGTEVILSPEKVLGTGELIPIDYPNLVKDAQVGDTILMDDGLLECRIIEKNGDLIKDKVIVGGLLKSRKGVNLPN